MRWGQKHIGKQRVLLHTGFWLAWVISFTVLQSFGQGRESFSMWLRYYVVTLPVFISHTYLIAYWLVPHTFYKKHYGLLITGVLVLLPVFSVIELLISNEMVFNFFDSSSDDTKSYLSLKNIVVSGIGNHYILLVFFAIKAGQEWYHSQIRKKEEQQLNEKAELEIYHYQLQPRLMLHLMEILRYTISHNPQKTPELIIHISNFFNLFLKENHADWRPLLAETYLMERYIQIHRLGLDKQVNCEIRVKGNLKPFVIPPFLFLPVLEFAMKTGKMCNDSFQCVVFIKGENRKLHFAVKLRSENKLEIAGNHDSEMLRLRLQHYFPGRFTIEEENNENFRKLQLEIFN
jgi:two-component system, LytTR family, sensor kinase